MLDALASQAQRKDTQSLPFGSGEDLDPPLIHKEVQPITGEHEAEFPHLPPILDPPSTPESDGWEAADRVEPVAGGFNIQESEPEVSSDDDDDAVARRSGPPPAASSSALDSSLPAARIIPEYEYSFMETNQSNRNLNGVPEPTLSPPMTQLQTQIPGMSPPHTSQQSQQSQQQEYVSEVILSLNPTFLFLFQFFSLIDRTQLPTVASLPSGPAAQPIVSLDMLGSPLPDVEESPPPPVAEPAAPAASSEAPKPAVQKRKRAVTDDSVLAESDSDSNESSHASQRSDISARRRKASQKVSKEDIMVLDDLDDLASIEIALEPTPPKRVQPPRSSSSPAAAVPISAAAVDSSIDIFGSGISKASPQSPLPSRSSSSPFNTPLQGAAKTAASPSPPKPTKTPQPSKQADKSTTEVVVTLRKRAPSQAPPPLPKITAMGRKKSRTFDEDDYGVDEADDFFDSQSIPRSTPQKEQPVPEKTKPKISPAPLRQPTPTPTPTAAPVAPPQSMSSKKNPQEPDAVQLRRKSTDVSVSSPSDSSRPRDKRIIKDNLGPVVEVDGPRKRTSASSLANASPTPEKPVDGKSVSADQSEPTSRPQRNKKEKEADTPAARESPPASRRRQSISDEDKARSESARFKEIEESSRKKRKATEAAPETDRDDDTPPKEASNKRRKTAVADDSAAAEASEKNREVKSVSYHKSGVPGEVVILIEKPTSKLRRDTAAPAPLESSIEKSDTEHRKRKSVGASSEADFPTAEELNESQKKRRKLAESPADQSSHQSKISSFFESSKGSKQQRVVPDTPPVANLRTRRSSSASEIQRDMEIDVFESEEVEQSETRPQSPAKRRDRSQDKLEAEKTSKKRDEVESARKVSTSDSIKSSGEASPKKRAPKPAITTNAAKPQQKSAVPQDRQVQQKLPGQQSSSGNSKSAPPKEIVQQKSAPRPEAAQPETKQRSASPTRAGAVAKSSSTTSHAATNQAKSSSRQREPSHSPVFLDLADSSPSPQLAKKKPVASKPWRQTEQEAHEHAEEREQLTPPYESTPASQSIVDPVDVFESGPPPADQPEKEDDDDVSGEWIAASQPKRLDPAVLRAAQLEQQRRREAAQKRTNPAPVRAASSPALVSPVPFAQQQQIRAPKSSSGPLPGQQQLVPLLSRPKPIQAAHGRPVVPPRNVISTKPSSNHKPPVVAPVDDDDEDNDPFADFADVKPLASLLKRNK
jgi:hypothetical protein